MILTITCLTTFYCQENKKEFINTLVISYNLLKSKVISLTHHKIPMGHIHAIEQHRFLLNFSSYKINGSLISINELL